MDKKRWHQRTSFIRAAQLLGLAEVAGGLALLLLRNDGAGGYSLLAVGAATAGSVSVQPR